MRINKDKYLSREELDEAFHFLHDAINRIAVRRRGNVWRKMGIIK